MTLTDIILEEIFLKLDLSASEKEKKAYMEELTPLVENTIMSAIVRTLTPEETVQLNQKEMTDEEYQMAVYDLVNNEERQKILGEALEELVQKLTSLPQ